MASVHKVDGTPYWHCFFYLPDGRRTHRSTGTTDKRKANSICMKMAEASDKAKEGRLIESRARATIADIFAVANDESLPTATVKEYLKGWIDGKRLEIAATSIGEYERIALRFVEFLGSRANRHMDAITTREAAAFRDNLAKRVSAATVNKTLKIIRSAWGRALRDGIVTDNIFARVDRLKTRKTNTRRAFTLPELRRLMDVATGEWRSMILFGLYTGQRLGDIATLTWNNVDTAMGEIRLQTAKTGRQQILPIAVPLGRHIATLPAGDDPVQPLHPAACEIVEREGRTSTLSRQFYDVMVSAGLALKRSHKGQEKGREARRKVNSISFHALRHTATSWMKNAGISSSIVEEFIGHDSAAVSRVYTHIETESMRRAADALPDILTSPAKTKKPRATARKGSA
jgi:integrase